MAKPAQPNSPPTTSPLFPAPPWADLRRGSSTDGGGAELGQRVCTAVVYNRARGRSHVMPCVCTPKMVKTELAKFKDDCQRFFGETSTHALGQVADDESPIGDNHPVRRGE